MISQLLRTRVPRPRDADNDRGQAMVEFGMVLPIFIMLVIGLLEFSLAFNANLAINFASRDAALIGAESGSDAIADCRILQTIERSVGSPASADRIQEVVIYGVEPDGSIIGENRYVRGGLTVCTFWDGVDTQEIRVNYSLYLGVEGYPIAQRCNVQAGCGPDRALDTIGVSIEYTHPWVTPLAGLVTLSGDGFTFTISNVMRMEPVL